MIVPRSRQGVLALATLTAFAAAACGDDDSTGLDGNGSVDDFPADLVATWDATSFVFTSDADSDVSVDVVDVGATVSITFESDGRYSLTLQIPGDSGELESGTAPVSGSTLTLTPDGGGDETVASFTLSGSTLTLVVTDAEFDFDDDGSDEPADVRVVLQKR